MKYQFLWIPRTGGSTIWGAIEKSSNSVCRWSDSKLSGRKDADYVTFQHRKIEKPKDRLTFTLIRNPYDRLASIYEKFQAMKGTVYQWTVLPLSFEEYIKHICTERIEPVSEQYSFKGLNYCNSMKDWLLDENGEMIPNLIIKTNQITERWDDICEVLGIDTLLINRNETRAMQSYIHYYTPEMLQLVADKYEWDLRLCEKVDGISAIPSSILDLNPPPPQLK